LVDHIWVMGRQNYPESLVDGLPIGRDDDAVRPAPKLREEFDDAKAGDLPMAIDTVGQDRNTVGSDAGNEGLEPLLDHRHIVIQTYTKTNIRGAVNPFMAR